MRYDYYESAQQILTPLAKQGVLRHKKGVKNQRMLEILFNDAIKSAATTYCWLRSRHNITASTALKIARIQASTGNCGGLDCAPYRNPQRWHEVGIA